MAPPSAQLDRSVADFSREVREGLNQLLQAFDYARDLECAVWEFSVELDRLLAAGMTTSDLRWLVKRGLLSHAREVTSLRDAGRSFEAPAVNLSFCRGTCFMLTAAGLSALGRVGHFVDIAPPSSREGGRPSIDLRGSAPHIAGDHFTPATITIPSAGVSASPPAKLRIGHVSHAKRERVNRVQGNRVEGKSTTGGAVPNWDRDSRVFVVGQHLVKQFRVPSPNQEAVLDAFQEEGWPRSVNDPLPPVPDQQPKRRLRDTIKCLNLNQSVRAIRFRGDGTGQRIFWELLPEAASHSADSHRQSHRRAA